MTQARKPGAEMGRKPRTGRKPAPRRKPPGATAPAPIIDYADFCRERGLHWPAGLPEMLAGPVGKTLTSLYYWPDRDSKETNSLAHGLALLASAVEPPPPHLLPLMPVDSRSIACAACVTHEQWGDPLGAEPGPAPCAVVRWHLGACPPAEQGAILDSDAALYVDSVAEELMLRPKMLGQLRRAGDWYQSTFIDQRRQPRSHDLKPFQVACQNVIIGLASAWQDVTFDGLRVEHYLTCEAPHLAAHEGDRALLAILLCEAFQAGGTMEIRFGAPGYEVALPPSLERYARSYALPLGAEEKGSISPAEARRLFLAVTPMTDDLRGRVADAIDRGLIAPERLCYSLMANHWDRTELDYILATSPQAASILTGGADVENRLARQVEIETCRAALMAGMLVRRLASTDAGAGGAKGVRQFEDDRSEIRSQMIEEEGAIAIAGFKSGIPWLQNGTRADADFLIAVPRGFPLPSDLDCVERLAEAWPEAMVALLVPGDMAELLAVDEPVLLCPERLAQLDAQAEGRLRAMELGRA